MSGNSLLFVYGTLVLAENTFAQHLSRYGKFLDEAVMNGDLYDIGAYPGAVYEPFSEKKVHGMVFSVPETPDFWKILDDYEGIGESQPEYARQKITVFVRADRIECWAYIYIAPVGSFIRIADGDYREYLSRTDGHLPAPH